MTNEYFAAVYEECADSVYRLSLFLTGKKEDAEDITQQTFLKFYREAPEFTGGEQIYQLQQKAWLLKTARNGAYDLFRSADRRKKASEIMGIKGDEGCGQFQEPRQNIYKEPEETALEEHFLLDGLSEKYRAPLYLFYYEEYSTSEIADILNLSETAVRARLSRGRKQLRKIVEEKGAY